MIKIQYGHLDNNNLIDISDKFIKLFIKNNILNIPINTNFNKIFGDPIPFIEKKIYINYNNFKIIINENDSKYNEIKYNFNELINCSSVNEINIKRKIWEKNNNIIQKHIKLLHNNDIINKIRKVLNNDELDNSIKRMSCPIGFEFNNNLVYLCTDIKDDNFRDETMGLDKKEVYFTPKIKDDYILIIDIGANIGSFTIDKIKNYPNSQIISVEPNPYCYHYLLHNLYLNDIPLISEGDIGNPNKPGVCVLNVACGITKGFTNLGFYISQSMLGTTDVNEKYQDERELITKKVEVVDIFSLLPKDFMIHIYKIDCEGDELEIIPHFREIFEDKRKIKYLIGELHQSLDGEVGGNDTFRKITEQTKHKLNLTREILAKRGQRNVFSWHIYC